jgi:hypothetical protein
MITFKEMRKCVRRYGCIVLKDGTDVVAIDFTLEELDNLFALAGISVDDDTDMEDGDVGPSA